MQERAKDLSVLVKAGLLCFIAAIAGGGLKMLGSELPHIESIQRQVALAILGVVLIGVDRVEQADPDGPTIQAIRESPLLTIASGTIVGVLLATALNAGAGAYKVGVLDSGDFLQGANTGATQGYVSLVGAALGTIGGVARRYLTARSAAIIVGAGGLIGASQAFLNPPGLAVISPQGEIGMTTLGLIGGVGILWVLGRLRL